ncbi:MAG: AtpZ/AtpI family protein [Nitriliruptoraceae bacterium]
MPSPDLSTPAPPPPATAGVMSGSGNAALFRGMDHAYMMQVELLAAIVVWGGAGWLVDRAIGTRPVFLVLGALVGYAAGLYLVWLRSQRMDAEERAATAADAAHARGQEVDRVG